MTMTIVPGRASTLADVEAWARTSRGADDCRALTRVAKLWEHVPLAARRIDLEAFERAFPRHGFDPLQHRSEDSYRAWRRKVIAVIKAYLGQTTPKAVLPAAVPKTDAVAAWDRLIEAISNFAESQGAGDFSVQRLIPIVTLSRRAKALGLAPTDLTPDAMIAVGQGLDGNERGSIIRALCNLNGLRGVPSVASLLPSAPYGLRPWPRRLGIGKLPPPLEAEIERWLDRSCGGVVDPVSGIVEGGTSKSDRDKKRTALRRYCVAALSYENAGPEASLSTLMTERIAVHVLQHWLKPVDGKVLQARSIAAYIQSVKIVAAHNDVPVQDLARVEEKAAVLRSGKKAGREMSPRVRRFCESVVDVKSQQIKLLSLHIRARRIAQQIIDAAASEDRDLADIERSRIRQLGAVAAFAAIETCGVPLRLSNAMQLTFRGPLATFLLPCRATPYARIVLPGRQVKNKRPVEAPLKEDSRHGLDTVMWYLRCIRPHFQHADEAIFLFPAVTSAGCLDGRVFRGWFKRISRQLGIPMCPHNFRHALASLLIKAHPGQYEGVAVLLGDTEGTVRCYYAWVNRQVQVEAAQALVMDLAHVA